MQETQLSQLKYVSGQISTMFRMLIKYIFYFFCRFEYLFYFFLLFWCFFLSRYTFFWFLVLLTKFAFSYAFEVTRVVAFLDRVLIMHWVQTASYISLWSENADKASNWTYTTDNESWCAELWMAWNFPRRFTLRIFNLIHLFSNMHCGALKNFLFSPFIVKSNAAAIVAVWAPIMVVSSQ